jgi:hypothetical protein
LSTSSVVGGLTFGFGPDESPDCPIAKLQQHVIVNKNPAPENPLNATFFTFYPLQDCRTMHIFVKETQNAACSVATNGARLSRAFPREVGHFKLTELGEKRL